MSCSEIDDALEVALHLYLSEFTPEGYTREDFIDCVRAWLPPVNEKRKRSKARKKVRLCPRLTR